MDSPGTVTSQGWTRGQAGTAAGVLLALVCLAGAAAMRGRMPAAQTSPMSHGSARFAASIDLNTAGPEELEALPGIGPALARRICEDREANGLFRSVRDLDRVRGIGPATIERIAPFVRVGEPR